MKGRPITNLSHKASEYYTQAVLSERVKPAGRSKYLASDNVALCTAALSKTSSWRDLPKYEPSKHNPALPLRPGAEDARKLPSVHGTQAVYKRGHA